jgi:hypothetical protein
MRTACHSWHQMLPGFKVAVRGAPGSTPRSATARSTDRHAVCRQACCQGAGGAGACGPSLACRPPLGTLSFNGQQQRGRGVAVACLEVPPTLPACTAPVAIAAASATTTAAPAPQLTAVPPSFPLAATLPRCTLPRASWPPPPPQSQTWARGRRSTACARCPALAGCAPSQATRGPHPTTRQSGSRCGAVRCGAVQWVFGGVRWGAAS